MRHHESTQQQVVAEHLKRAGIFFCAVPNGRGKVKPWVGAIWKREGLVAGAPDLLIFDAPPCADEYCGVALEMKDIEGDGPTDSQRSFLEALEARGWMPLVAYGAVDAFKKLTALGFKGLPQ